MASVHVKVDTGMHRVGTPSVEAVKVAKLVADSQWLSLEGMFTHLATADAADTQFVQQQVSSFSNSVEQVRACGIEVRHVHISNSASAIRRLDAGAGCTMARVGIALYGIPGDAHTNSFGASHQLELRPVMSVRARVSHVQRVLTGQGVSYGLKRKVETDVNIATIPLGYADGVPRGLWESGSALIGGVRRSFAGVVTMDQIMVNCANDEVSIGDEVVLIGAQGSELVTANEWANKMGTIGYEIVCAISARMPRSYIN
jgi:alanine racemase